MMFKSVFASKPALALAAILALGSLSLATDAFAAHGGGGGGHGVVAVVAMAVVEVADFTAAVVADFVPVGAVVDTSAVTHCGRTSRAWTLRACTCRAYTRHAWTVHATRRGWTWTRCAPSRLDIETVHTSRLDTTAISGTAVGVLRCWPVLGMVGLLRRVRVGLRLRLCKARRRTIATTDPSPTGVSDYGPGGHVASTTIHLLDCGARMGPLLPFRFSEFGWRAFQKTE